MSSDPASPPTVGSTVSESARPKLASEPSDPPKATEAKQSIAAHASIVALGTLSSRALGLVREMVLAATFSRAITDAYTIASLLPNSLRALFAEGAVQSAIIPALAERRAQAGESAARDSYLAIRSFMAVVLLLITALGIWLSPWLVSLFAEGFEGEIGSEGQDKLKLTIELTRWTFPYIFFMGSTAMGLAALNLKGRFVATSFAPALFNVALIACCLLLPRYFESIDKSTAYAIAAGFLVGGVAQWIAQFPSLKRIGYLKGFRLDLRDPALRVALRRWTPVLVGFGVYYIDLIIARRFLSYLGEGAPSYFNFAMRLADFPQGIFVLAIQAAALPALSRLSAEGKRVEYAQAFGFSLRLTLLVAVPASLWLMFYAEDCISLIYERGAFGEQDRIETTRALLGQASGVWLVALVRQFVVAFHSSGDTRTPVIISILDLAAFVLCAYWLKSLFGHAGISWAIACASLVQAALLGLVFYKRVPELQLKPLLSYFLKIASAAVIAIGASRWLVNQAGLHISFLHRGLGPILIGFTITMLFCAILFKVLGIEEWNGLLAGLKRRILRRQA